MNPTQKPTAGEAFERVADGFLVVDDGWKVTRVSEEAEQLLDVDADDVEDTEVWAAFPEVVGTRFEEGLYDSVETRDITGFEYHHDPSGEWYRVFCCPTEHNLTVYLERITEEKEAKVERERLNRQLLLINRLVRHDVRNDMTVVLGWGEELRNHVDEEGEEVLDRILESTRHAVRLTENSRDYVELVTGGSETEPEPLALDVTLADELERFRRIFGDASIHSEEVPDVEVYGNALLSSVLYNIVGNAVKHSDREVPDVEITFEVDDDSVRISVADDGPGVPPERRDAVFGRGDRGLEDPAAGLGLHLVDTVVEGCGGEVWIEDNEPRGAVFVVELPRADAGGAEA